MKANWVKALIAVSVIIAGAILIYLYLGRLRPLDLYIANHEHYDIIVTIHYQKTGDTAVTESRRVNAGEVWQDHINYRWVEPQIWVHGRCAKEH